MYEHHLDRPLPTHAFVRRMLRHAGYGSILIVASLAVGTLGFRMLADQAPIDALLNAAMLLGGMGPIGDFTHVGAAGKLFAAAFALYAGLVFLILAGLLATPVFHRVLHRFHWERQRGE